MRDAAIDARCARRRSAAAGGSAGRACSAFAIGTSPTMSSSPTMPMTIDGLEACSSCTARSAPSKLRATIGCPASTAARPRSAAAKPAQQFVGELACAEAVIGCGSPISVCDRRPRVRARAAARTPRGTALRRLRPAPPTASGVPMRAQRGRGGPPKRGRAPRRPPFAAVERLSAAASKRFGIRAALRAIRSRAAYTVASGPCDPHAEDVDEQRGRALVAQAQSASLHDRLARLRRAARQRLFEHRDRPVRCRC